MIEGSNYYYRFPEVLEDRLDFIFYHPNFDKITNLVNNLKYPLHKVGEYFIRTWTGENLEVRDSKEKKYLYVKVENVVDNKIVITENSEFLSEAELSILSNSIAKPDSILVTRVASFGKSAVVSKDFRGAISDNILCFELNEKVEPAFISRFINSMLAKMQLQQSVAGMGRGVLTYDRIGDLYVGVPSSRDEQRQIVEQVESIESQAINLENEAKTVMSQAEKVLLQKLGINMPSKLERIDYYIDFFDDLNRLDFVFNNPRYDIVEELISESNITFVELSEVAYSLQDSRNPMESPNEQFLYADIGNIDTRWGVINPVTMYGKDAKSSRIRRVMYAGTVLVSTTRPTRNAIAIVPEGLDNQICSTGLAVLRCKENMDNRFLFHALRTQLTNLQFEKYCSGSGYPAITQKVDLPKIKVPLPPTINDQVRIVNKIENILEEAKGKELEAKLKWQKSIDMFEYKLGGN
ncbi:MAG: hypothetical protein OEZ00_02335 [Dehalococcoidia bacterium]|nr:hypothetical protein [Dehalococcoidia bacterium]